MAAIEQQLGGGVVVRSDDVEGNEVSGVVWPGDRPTEERRFVVLFTDGGEVIDCRIDPR